MRILIVICIITIGGIKLSAQNGATAESKGNQIGLVIKSAIETAVPAIGTLMNLIWPKKSGSSEDKPNATKSEIQTALDIEKSKWKQKMKDEMIPIAAIGEELTIVKRFVKPADEIQIQMKVISTILDEDMDAGDWKLIKSGWDIAFGFWEEFGSVTDDELSKISSYYVRSKLTLIRDSGKKLRKSIDEKVKSSEFKNLVNETNQAFEMMSHVNLVLLFYVDDFSKGFKDLSDYLNNSMSVTTEMELTPLQKEIQLELNKFYPEER